MAHGKSGFVPFANDAASVGAGGLTIENGTLQISIYGSADIGRDRAGLAAAIAIRDTAQAIVAALEAMTDLPEHAVMPPPITGTTQNPFG